MKWLFTLKGFYFHVFNFLLGINHLLFAIKYPETGFIVLNYIVILIRKEVFYPI